MTITRTNIPRSKYSPLHLWYERGMALLASVNLIFVFFNLSYIPLRDFWLQGRIQLLIKTPVFAGEFPHKPIRVLPFSVAYYYDWVKGIEPYRDTQEYLEKVEKLNQIINQQALEQTGQNNQKEKIDLILLELRQLSRSMIEDNPFQVANKTGTLERIKNKMRQHIFGSNKASAKDAFDTFWSRPHLLTKGYRQELNFFENEIKPLIETNYFRPVGENGEPIDNFPLLDFPFVLLFFLEFLVRTWLLSRRYTGVTWFDAMLWRWYDIFFFLPFFRWFRIIPVVIRLNQAQLIDLNAIKKQASQGFVAAIAEDITEVVFLRFINQMQGLIKEGVIRNFIGARKFDPYIDINDINETAEIIKIVGELVINQVLPKIKPEAENFLCYNLEQAITQNSLYQNLQKIPGVDPIKTQITQTLSSQIYQKTCELLSNTLQEDPKFKQLLEELKKSFTQTINAEIRTQKSIEKIEILMIDFLEEIKINYVERLSQEDIEELLEQTRQLRQKSAVVAESEVMG